MKTFTYRRCRNWLFEVICTNKSNKITYIFKVGLIIHISNSIFIYNDVDSNKQCTHWAIQLLQSNQCHQCRDVKRQVSCTKVIGQCVCPSFLWTSSFFLTDGRDNSIASFGSREVNCLPIGANVLTTSAIKLMWYSPVFPVLSFI